MKPKACAFLLFFNLLFVFDAIPAMADELQLSKDGVGPIFISMKVHVRDANDELTAFPRKLAELTLSARNDSGEPIGFVKFCVQAARRMKGCDFQAKTPKKVWEPGEELVWTLDGKARRGIENPKITIVQLKEAAGTRDVEVEDKTAVPSPTQN
jgi:hypothetical protein